MELNLQHISASVVFQIPNYCLVLMNIHDVLFSIGDIVGVSPSQKGGASSATDPSGIVSRVKPSSITVAFDHSDAEGAITFEHEGFYRLTKLANDVTYRRLKR